MQSQRRAIAAHLNAGKTITALEALGVFGTFRLAARIEELRNPDGHGYKDLQPMVIHSVIHKDTNGKSYARYALTPEFNMRSRVKLVSHEASEKANLLGHRRVPVGTTGRVVGLYDRSVHVQFSGVEGQVIVRKEDLALVTSRA